VRPAEVSNMAMRNFGCAAVIYPIAVSFHASINEQTYSPSVDVRKCTGSVGSCSSFCRNRRI